MRNELCDQGVVVGGNAIARTHAGVDVVIFLPFFFSSRRRHTRWTGDWSSDVCSSDLADVELARFVELGVALARRVGAQAADALRPAFAAGQHLAEMLRVRAVQHVVSRSEERRVGKECRSRWATYDEEK